MIKVASPSVSGPFGSYSLRACNKAARSSMGDHFSTAPSSSPFYAEYVIPRLIREAGWPGYYSLKKSSLTLTNAAAVPPRRLAASSRSASVCAQTFSMAAEEGLPSETTNTDHVSVRRKDGDLGDNLPSIAPLTSSAISHRPCKANR